MMRLAWILILLIVLSLISTMPISYTDKSRIILRELFMQKLSGEVYFSPDGRKILDVVPDNLLLATHLIMYNDTGEKLWEKTINGKVGRAVWSPNSKYIVMRTSDVSAVIINSTNGNMITINFTKMHNTTKKLFCGAILWSRDSKYVLFDVFELFGDHEYIDIYYYNGTYFRTIVLTGNGWIAEWLPKGDALLIYEGYNISLYTVDGKLLWNITFPRGLLSGECINYVLISPDGSKILLYTYKYPKYFMSVIDARTGEILWNRTIDRYISPQLVVWTPDGELLTIVTSSGIYTFNATTGDILWKLQLVISINSIKWVNQGKYLIVYHKSVLDTLVVVFDREGNLLWKKVLGKYIGFVADGKYIVTCYEYMRLYNNTIIGVYNISTGEQILTLHPKLKLPDKMFVIANNTVVLYEDASETYEVYRVEYQYIHSTTTPTSVSTTTTSKTIINISTITTTPTNILTTSSAPSTTTTTSSTMIKSTMTATTETSSMMTTNLSTEKQTTIDTTTIIVGATIMLVVLITIIGVVKKK